MNGGDASGAGERASLERWREILGGTDVERLMETVTDVSDEGQRLRSSSPFVGALSPKSARRYSPPVNKERLIDLNGRVKLVAGVELPVVVGSQSLYAITSQVSEVVKHMWNQKASEIPNFTRWNCDDC